MCPRPSSDSVARRRKTGRLVAQCPVDFARELNATRSFLTEQGYRSAVIGGVALAAYGHPRLTLDLDIVTEAAAQDSLVARMESTGFETLHRSAGYSNHRHPEPGHGRVDFMYVRGETAERVFAGVRQLPGPGGIVIAVPRPEHLIAMKVRAMAEAPERIWQDLADIDYLVRLDAWTVTRCGDTSNARALEGNGVSSNEPSDSTSLNLERDVPTTRQDVEALRRLRRETPSWLLLPPEAVDALLPAAGLAHRPTTSPGATPFEFP